MGRVPVAGIPRMVRPRKKWGTVYGFSVVDVGGNWLRFSRIGDREPAADEATGGLVGIVEVAARLADSKGDDAQAIATLERGIARHADAPAIDRARALLYLAELAVRVGDDQLARSSFGAALTVELDAAEREALGPDVTHVEALLGARA